MYIGLYIYTYVPDRGCKTKSWKIIICQKKKEKERKKNLILNRIIKVDLRYIVSQKNYFEICKLFFPNSFALTFLILRST